jgi:hypothetical protein
MIVDGYDITSPVLTELAARGDVKEVTMDGVSLT